ncbi:MAG: T9SS type A sorting domain-containing protein [candidate division WOR-3 bacterium]
MTNRTRRIVSISALLLLANLASAQDYKIPWQSFNSGGLPGVGTSHRMNGSLAQSIQGTASATNRLGYWGFWYGLGPGGVPPALDIECVQIVAPSGYVAANTEVKPKATYRNNGDAPTSFTAYCFLEDPSHTRVHSPTEPVEDLGPGESRTVEFTGYNVGEVLGDWAVKCSAYVFGDQDPDNDWKLGSFNVQYGPPWPYGWVEVANVPYSPSNRSVKDGGWLATGPDKEKDGFVVYAAKGYKTPDFYKYDPMTGANGTWHDLKPIPSEEEGRNKPPSKGCRGVSDNVGAVYMTKGNNTLGFWRYDIEEDTWTALTGVPEGVYRKRVKGGEDMVFVQRDDTGWVYLLKGYKTEFYRYNIQAGRWDTLPEVPYGANKQKYDKGSFLVYDGDNTIYAHQAKYNDGANHYMFRYDIEGDSWYKTAKKGMPVFGLENGRAGKKKKSKDGAAGAWYDGNIYALKGGNTQGFFKYFPQGDSWTQLDTVPGNGTTNKKKRVKSGGDLVYYGYAAFFALKGNKTLETWRYREPPAFYVSGRTPYIGVQAGKLALGSVQFAISPNPMASGWTTVRYTLPKPGPVSIAVFDVAGRCVLARKLVAADCVSVASLDLRKIPAGVYLVRFDADGATATQKLVVQR